ncbi:MAG: glycoside hydrolase family 57 protein [Acidilobus sp.]
MTENIVLFFELHQPIRLKRLSAFTPPNIPLEFDDMIDFEANNKILARVVERTYRKATKILIDAASEVPGFKFTMSVAGVLLEALRKDYPDVIELLSTAVSKGIMEPVAQTYYHSLASLIDENEFIDQVRAQADLVADVLGFRPVVAENTEFIYNNDIGCLLYRNGFKAVVTEGVEWALGWRSPNYVYLNPLCGVRLLLRNYRLSDDIGFRFGDRNWDQYPLTADKYARWVSESPGDLVLVAVDFETFGEHHWPESGIYEFLRWLPRELGKRGVNFLTVSSAAELTPKGIYDVPPWSTISWADAKDLGAWLGNEMQRKAFEVLRRYYFFARAVGGKTLERWRILSTSDHFYYMATKGGPEGAVHSYFSHLGSPYEAYLAFSYALYALGREIRMALQREPCLLVNVNLPRELCFHLKEGSQVCSLGLLPDLMAEVGGDQAAVAQVKRWVGEVFGVELESALELAKRCKGAYEASQY